MIDAVDRLVWREQLRVVVAASVRHGVAATFLIVSAVGLRKICVGRRAAVLVIGAVAAALEDLVDEHQQVD